MRVVNKKLPLVGMEPNRIEGEGGVQLQVFRHSFQVKKRFYFFWITAKTEITPPLTPSTSHSSNWEEDCVLKRLIAGGRRTLSLNIEDVTREPEPKRPKVTKATTIETTINDAASNTIVQATISTSAVQSSVVNHSATSWWESGDARKLLKPNTDNYGANECVKEIVMERIELLESVNRKGKSWENHPPILLR